MKECDEKRQIDVLSGIHSRLTFEGWTRNFLMHQAYNAFLFGIPKQDHLSQFPRENFARQHSIHPAPRYPWLKSSDDEDPWLKPTGDLAAFLATYTGVIPDVQKHLETFSLVTIISGTNHLHGHKASCVKLIYSLANRFDWVDIIVENKVSPPIHVGKQLPKESVHLYGQQQHTLSEGQVWKGEDLFLEMNSSSHKSVRVQLGVDLMFNMGVSEEMAEMFLRHMGYSQAHRSWAHVWTKVVAFKKRRSTFLLSLSGSIGKVTLKNWDEADKNVSLNVFWIPTFNSKFKELTDVRPLLETTRRSPGHLYTHHGFIFDGSFQPRWKKYASVCIAPFAFITYKQKIAWTNVNDRVDYSQLKGTWIEAMHLCAKFNGSLPILRSREELDHLLSLFKLPYQTPPPMPVMFIGLIKTKVTLWFSSFQ